MCGDMVICAQMMERHKLKLKPILTSSLLNVNRDPSNKKAKSLVSCQTLVPPVCRRSLESIDGRRRKNFLKILKLRG